MKKTYHVTAKIWLYQGNAAWHFITLPVATAHDIDDYFAHAKRGWGSLPVVATIGSTTWKTSIFPDKKSGSYMLPLKAEVRKKENLAAGNNVEVSLEISD